MELAWEQEGGKTSEYQRAPNRHKFIFCRMGIKWIN